MKHKIVKSIFVFILLVVVFLAYIICDIYFKDYQKNNVIGASFTNIQFLQHGNAGNGQNGRGDKVANSRALFKYAIDSLEFKMVECDVMITKDSIPVLSHDDVINFVACKLNGERIQDTIRISESTLSDLDNYSFGGGKFLGDKIMKLSELLELCHEKDVILMIELKCDKTKENARIIYDLIKQKNMLSYVFIETIDNDVACYFMDLDTDIALSYQMDGVFSIYGIDEIIKRGYHLRSKHIIISELAPYIFPRNLSSLYHLKTAIDYGHSKGFIMKIATIDNIYLAKLYFYLGIDLINSNVLTNSELTPLTKNKNLSLNVNGLCCSWPQKV